MLVLKKKHFIILVFIFTVAQAQASVIKGVVRDIGNGLPVAGVSVCVYPDTLFAVTDSAGNFIFEHLLAPVINLSAFHIGYESQVITKIVLSEGKEAVVDIFLTASVATLSNITIRPALGVKMLPGNPALVFGAADTRFYPAAIGDPSRIVQNVAGVAGFGDNGNLISVRGANPRSTIWRLEGIEIQNPNHFSALGSNGGVISMISGNTLGASSFYNGGMSSEMANSLGGAFDLYFRTGNSAKLEHSVVAGLLGIELSSEGYLNKKSKASYLCNYRYSTLKLMKKYIRGFADISPDYQDYNAKITFHTKKGCDFSFFALGGINRSNTEPARDSAAAESRDNIRLSESGKTNILGVTINHPVDQKSFIKTILAFSSFNYAEMSDSFKSRYSNEIVSMEKVSHIDHSFRTHTYFQRKISARDNFKTGINIDFLFFKYNIGIFNPISSKWSSYLKIENHALFLQFYLQYVKRITPSFSVDAGLHTSYMSANTGFSMNPQIALKYRKQNSTIFIYHIGLYSRPEHLSIYYFQDSLAQQRGNFPNTSLKVPKSFQSSISMERPLINQRFNFKLSVYYHWLFDIAVENKENSDFSMLNITSLYNLIGREQLISKGRGKNYGLEATFEGVKLNKFQFLTTASFYVSKFSDINGHYYNTRFNRNFNVNIIGGREWAVGKKKRGLLTITSKMNVMGGLRNSEIDLIQSRIRGVFVPAVNRYFTQRNPTYFRIDLSLSYRFNAGKTGHTLSFDVQNLTNRRNVFNEQYDKSTAGLRFNYQWGLVPLASYKLNF